MRLIVHTRITNLSFEANVIRVGERYDVLLLMLLIASLSGDSCGTVVDFELPSLSSVTMDTAGVDWGGLSPPT